MAALCAHPSPPLAPCPGAARLSTLQCRPAWHAGWRWPHGGHPGHIKNKSQIYIFDDNVHKYKTAGFISPRQQGSSTRHRRIHKSNTAGFKSVQYRKSGAASPIRYMGVLNGSGAILPVAEAGPLDRQAAQVPGALFGKKSALHGAVDSGQDCR